MSVSYYYGPYRHALACTISLYIYIMRILVVIKMALIFYRHGLHKHTGACVHSSIDSV